MNTTSKPWAHYIVLNHNCFTFHDGFFTSSLHVARSFQNYWGGKIVDINTEKEIL
jgi:hypothetical protein